MVWNRRIAFGIDKITIRVPHVEPDGIFFARLKFAWNDKSSLVQPISFTKIFGYRYGGAPFGNNRPTAIGIHIFTESNADFFKLCRVHHFEESIKLELRVADLYLLFHKLFPQDAKFWWKLVLEEKNHASLVISGKYFFEPQGKFPHGILEPDLQKQKDANSKLDSV